MSHFDLRVERIKNFWQGIFGSGPSYETCVAASVGLLGLLYAVALVVLIPVSIIRAFRRESL